MGTINHLFQDTMTVSEPTGTKGAMGDPLRKPFDPVYSGVPCKVMDATATQRMTFGQLGIDVSHIVHTEQDGIVNGHIMLTSDGRLLRVTGVQKIRTMGGIDTFYKITGFEIRQGS